MGNDEIAKLPDAVRKHARKHPQPSWLGPMLATLVDQPFSSRDWIFEPKLDGERCLTFRRAKGPCLCVCQLDLAPFDTLIWPHLALVPPAWAVASPVT